MLKRDEKARDSRNVNTFGCRRHALQRYPLLSHRLLIRVQSYEEISQGAATTPSMGMLAGSHWPTTTGRQDECCKELKSCATPTMVPHLSAERGRCSDIRCHHTHCSSDRRDMRTSQFTPSKSRFGRKNWLKNQQHAEMSAAKG